MKLLHLLRRIIINGIYSSEIIRFLRLCLIKPFHILSYGEIILSLPLWTKSYHEAIQKIPYSIVLTIYQNFTKGNYSLFGENLPLNWLHQKTFKAQLWQLCHPLTFKFSGQNSTLLPFKWSLYGRTFALSTIYFLRFCTSRKFRFLGDLLLDRISSVKGLILPW